MTGHELVRRWLVSMLLACPITTGIVLLLERWFR